MTNPILVTGAEGMLGSAVVRAGISEGVEVVGLSKQDCDIGDRLQVAKVLGEYHDPVVINCAGIVRERSAVVGAEIFRVNALGPRILAQYASRLVHVSTDCVFDGTITEGAYYEDSEPNPADRYGWTKLAGEEVSPHHLVVRTSFVGLGQRGLLHWLLSHPEGAEVPGYTNWLWNGWTASALAPLLLDLATKPKITGLLHLPGPEVVTKGWLLAEVAQRLRPDLKVVLCDAPEARRMVLATTRDSAVPPDVTWDWMLDELEQEYVGIMKSRWHIAMLAAKVGKDYEDFGGPYLGSVVQG